MRRTRYFAATASCLLLSACSGGATPFSPTSLTPGRPAWSDNVPTPPPPTGRDTCIIGITTLHGGNIFGSGT
ncbi:MAG TPA: hypothetical protein VNP72_03130 [Longimicrobium sp.]|nr:hypothetical protein [Longimicrobium sp.]